MVWSFWSYGSAPRRTLKRAYAIWYNLCMTISMINVSEEVQRLHDRIEANVRLLAKNYLGNRYVPTDEFIRLKEVFYTEAKYAAAIIPAIYACRDLPKLQLASDCLDEKLLAAHR